MTEESWVGLKEAINGVRSEIAAAVEESEASNDRIRFGVENIELEFTVDFRRTRDISGGVKVWVAQLDRGVQSAKSHTHRVKLTLNPFDSATGFNPQAGGLNS